MNSVYPPNLPLLLKTESSDDFDLSVTVEHSLLHFHHPQQVLSSAVLNGGTTITQDLLNLRVDKCAYDTTQTPEQSLENHLEQLQVPLNGIGMMTAASMKSFSHQQVSYQSLEVHCFVTAGLSNARQIGESADSRLQAGTINLWLYVNQPLSMAAQVEAVMMVTEAKTAALFENQIKSTKNSQPATGTGTDSLAIISPTKSDDSHLHSYCGKHTILGELIGKSCLSALRLSIQKCITASQ